MHVSNVHLDLPPLVARVADAHDPPLCVRACHDVPTDGRSGFAMVDGGGCGPGDQPDQLDVGRVDGAESGDVPVG